MTDGEDTKGQAKPSLPRNLAGQANKKNDGKQFESMTDLRGSQGETFEILQGEEVLASKRVKPLPKEVLADSLLETPQERNSARASLAQDLEEACLMLVEALGENVNLDVEAGEEERRAALLRAVKEVLCDKNVTAECAAVAALVAGYYRDNQADREQVGYFAADRVYYLEKKRKAPSLFPPDTAAHDEETIMANLVSGFAVSENFLFAIYAKIKDHGYGWLAETIKEERNKQGQVFYRVTFAGGENTLVESLSEGEKAYGAGDLRGYFYPAVLEKAYGKVLLAGREQPPLADGAWKAHYPGKAHTGLAMLSGVTPYMVPVSVSNTAEGREAVLEYLRRVRAAGESLLGVLKMQEPDKFDQYRADGLKHVRISFSGAKIIMTAFNRLGRLFKEEITVDELLARALYIY